MRLSGIGMNNSLFSNYAINQKVSKLNNENNMQNGLTDLTRQQRNRDSIFISKQGKKESIIQQLMNQKQLIQESKNAELKRGLEDGYINEDKLAEYDEQLEMIDRQIAEATTEQSVEDDKEKNENLTNNKVITEKEYEQRNMMNIMSNSLGMEQVEVISSVKDEMNGEARVLKAEIKSDGDRALESKKKRVQEIEARTTDLLEQVGDKTTDINNNITESKDNVIVKDDTDEEEINTESENKIIVNEKNSNLTAQELFSI